MFLALFRADEVFRAGCADRTGQNLVPQRAQIGDLTLDERVARAGVFAGQISDLGQCHVAASHAGEGSGRVIPEGRSNL